MWRCNEGHCIYCAQLGLSLEKCHVQRSSSASQAFVLVSTSPSKNKSCGQFSQITLSSETLAFSHTVLIDSGADANLIDDSLAGKPNLSIVHLDPAPLFCHRLELWFDVSYRTFLLTYYPDFP